MKMQWESNGEGRPLVLVPGVLTGWLSWEEHARRLSSDRRVVRVQLLNVQLGLENRTLPTDYSVKTESRALDAAIAEAGIAGQFDLVAWSMGALVSLDYALDHPERVRSLTLIEPPAFWVLSEPDEAAKRDIDAFRAMPSEVTEDVLEGFLRRASLIPPGSERDDLPNWPLWMEHRRALRAVPLITDHQDDLGRLAAIKAPVLLVKGTASMAYYHQIIDEIAARLPSAEIAEWPAGHGPHIVSIEPFLEKLTSFLDETANTPSTV